MNPKQKDTHKKLHTERLHKNISTLRLNKVKLLNTKDKEKILIAVGEENRLFQRNLN